MRLVEIALDDSGQHKICEFLKEICKLEVKTVRNVMADKKGVVVGEILQILSKNMEPRKEQVIMLMKDVMGNSEPANKFKAVILGRIATMLMRAQPEIGDRLGFDCGYIYPDPSFIRCLYKTSYNIEIGPGETDQLFFIRKKSTMNQAIKESDFTTVETINKLKELENVVNSYMSCMQNLPKVLDSCKAIRKCLENRSQTHQFPEKCNTRVPPSSINESSMGRCEAGPSNSKNTTDHLRSTNIQKDGCFILPESNKVQRVQTLQSKTGTRNEKESNLIKETRNPDNSSKETRNEKENDVNSLKNNISRVENRRKNFLQPLPIKPQAASRQTKQNKPQPIPMNLNTNKNSNYKYVTIEIIKQLDPRISDWCHLFGVVIKILKPMVYTSKGKRTMICLLMDDSCENDLVCHFFLPDDKILKHINCGDVLRLHRMKLEDNGVRNDGRVFNNNDIVLFKSNSENLTPIKVAIRTSITDEDKARIKTLLEWYQANYERLSQEQDQNVPETNSETHHPPVQTASGSNKNKLDNNADNPAREASTSQDLKENKSHTDSAEKVDPIQNKILEKNSKNNEQKQQENNNNQIKRKPLFVTDNNNDLSTAGDSSDVTGAQSPFVQFDNNISLRSIQNAIGSKNNFVTSTPKRVVTPKEVHNFPEGTSQVKGGSNGITEHQVKALDPTNLTRTNSKPSSDRDNNFKNITYRKRRMDDSDDEPLINISSKAKRGPSFPSLSPPLLVDLVTPDQLLTEHDQTDHDKALGQKNLNKSAENPLQSPPLRLDPVTPEKPDDEVETIENIRVTAHSNEKDSYSQDELDSGSDQASSSGIDLISLEADLLLGNNEVQDDQITADSPGELSSISAVQAFHPGPLAVKVHVTKVRPDPSGEILNIVSGFCTEDCKGLFVFTDLHWVSQNSHIPMCPTCFLTKGKQYPVRLIFMLAFDLLESDTGFKIDDAILSLGEAEFFFGCSVEEFCKDKKKQKTVQQMLKTIVLNRERDSSFPFTISPPKIFHLFPNPNLKQIFIRQTKLKYT